MTYQATIEVEGTQMKIWFRFMYKDLLVWMQETINDFMNERKGNFDGGALLCYILKKYGAEISTEPYYTALHLSKDNILDVREFIVRINRGAIERVK